MGLAKTIVLADGDISQVALETFFRPVSSIASRKTKQSGHHNGPRGQRQGDPKDDMNSMSEEKKSPGAHLYWSGCESKEASGGNDLRDGNGQDIDGGEGDACVRRKAEERKDGGEDGDNADVGAFFNTAAVERPPEELTYKKRKSLLEERIGITDVNTPTSSASGAREEESRSASDRAAVKKLRTEGDDSRPSRTPKKLVQLYIDLGQDSWQYTTCHVCGLMYSRGELDDEKLHAAFHNTFTERMTFRGWQNERVVWTSDDGKMRIILVQPKDPHAHWQKVKEICIKVAAQLG
eukprot:CAMPEP_0198223994 /NCGR_PEP_ID=MMETSP1445-20131203/94919_1 /TAXON_ID=36898 /ORGANISM="Pyramimonas sp., Strain CCMP2087" /LENGTH=292 /DNA_ID=CAMNT_0043903007 /DNA_START=376 /DNA_END=1251 /DNA_ORIENTATION=+